MLSNSQAALTGRFWTDTNSRAQPVSSAAPLCGEADQLSGVDAVQVELAVKDPGGGLQMGGPFFDGRVVRRTQRVACGQWDLLGVKEERGNGEAHDRVLLLSIGVRLSMG
jgi:hypothetical protein